MKYDTTKKQTIGAKRTLHQLKEALESLLIEKSFDDISVIEICEHGFPQISLFPPLTS